jgi:hypothetical protein
MYGPKDLCSLKPTELKDANIVLKIDRGRYVCITSVAELLSHFENCLPPAHEYYDQYFVSGVKVQVAHNKQCFSCWQGRRNKSGCDCKRIYTICATESHVGDASLKIHATQKW